MLLVLWQYILKRGPAARVRFELVIGLNMVATSDAIIHINLLSDRIWASPGHLSRVSTVTSRLRLLLQMLVVLNIAAMASSFWRSLSDD